MPDPGIPRNLGTILQRLQRRVERLESSSRMPRQSVNGSVFRGVPMVPTQWVSPSTVVPTAVEHASTTWTPAYHLPFGVPAGLNVKVDGFLLQEGPPPTDTWGLRLRQSSLAAPDTPTGSSLGSVGGLQAGPALVTTPTIFSFTATLPEGSDLPVVVEIRREVSGTSAAVLFGVFLTPLPV